MRAGVVVEEPMGTIVMPRSALRRGMLDPQVAQKRCSKNRASGTL
ncbi:MAG: hypothetical protein U0326_05410 [Polyangiales bacterium]